MFRFKKPILRNYHKLAKNKASRMQQQGSAQSGQALLLGLLLLSASCLAALGFIRLARLLEEKTQLINAADAAAYSTGVLHARLLNYDAYTNRALIANEIALAQWLTLASWSQHISSAIHNISAEKNIEAQWQQTGLDAYTPRYHAMRAFATQITQLESNAQNAAQKHNQGKIAISQSQQYAHTHMPLATVRRRLQGDIVQANLNNANIDIYGWHRGNFQGLDESDTPNHTETPFTQKDAKRSIQLLTQLANQDPFLKERQWTMSGAVSYCKKNIDNQIKRSGNTTLALNDWVANDELTWLHAKKCQKKTTVLSQNALSSSAWKLSPPVQLRMLSDVAQQESLPRYLYRFRIRHRFQHLPLLSNAKWKLFDSNSSSKVEREGERAVTRQYMQYGEKPHSEADKVIRMKWNWNDPEKDELPYGYKDFRVTSEVYFQKPEKAAHIEKGDLLHPYWHVRLVKLPDEKGQALIESLCILVITATLLIGLLKIGKTLTQSHNALINSRNIAFQAAYQADLNMPLPAISSIQYIPPANTFRSDTLPDDQVSKAFQLTDKGIAVAQWPLPQARKNSETISRKTVLLIGTYAEKSNVPIPMPGAVFPKTTLPISVENLIKKIEGDTIYPPLVNQTQFWQIDSTLAQGI